VRFELSLATTIAGAVALLCTVCAIVKAADQPVMPAGVLTEMSTEISKGKAQTNGFVATILYSKSSSNRKDKSEFTFMIKKQGENLLLEIIEPCAIQSERFTVKEVRAVNSKYSFNAIHRDAGWVLSKLDESETYRKTFATEYARTGLNFDCFPWRVAGHLLPELFTRRDVKLSAFQMAPMGRASEVVIELSLPTLPAQDVKSMVPMDRCKVVLDARNHWRLDSYEYSPPNPNFRANIQGAFTYRPDGFLEKLEQTSTVDKQDYKSVVSMTVLSLENRKINEHEFTLSAYGLPELPGVTWERPTPTYVWLLLAAAVLGVVAVGCRWLLKRRAKVVPPPVPPTPTA